MNSQSVSVTFPISFFNSCLNVIGVATRANDSNGKTPGYDATSISKTGFICTNGTNHLVNLNMPNVKVARAAYMNGTFANCKILITEFTLSGGLGSSSMFNNTATIPPAKVIVNYTTADSGFVDGYIANKTPAECNIVKGVNIDL